MRIALCLIAFVAMATAGCLEVGSDRILAGDLVDSVPLLRPLDPATVVGFAPVPGTQRIFSGRELALFARQHDLTPDPGIILPSVCVLRAAHPVSLDDLKAVLIRSLNLPSAIVDVVEYSNQPLGMGRLEFPLSGLNRPPGDAPDSAVIWRGRLIYDQSSSAPVWAKVRITVAGPCLVAKEAIQAGTPVRADQLEEASLARFPFSAAPLRSARDAVGRLARRNIAAGQIFLAGALEQLREVNRGDHIRVKVIAGRALVSFEAVAESSGGVGESVVVRNPLSGKNFRAVVDDKGSARVESSPGAGI